MQKVFDFFDKAYCINLDCRPDRWQNAQKEFSKVNIPVERLSAIHTPKDGALGCAMSHIKAIRQAILLNVKNLLIFEDDIGFFHSTDHIAAALKLLPSNWEMVFFGGIVFTNEKNHMKVADHVYVARDVVCAHAVGISTNGMKKILAQYRYRRGFPIDEYYRGILQPQRTSFVIHPMVVRQIPSASDITGQPANDHNLHLITNDKFI